MGLTLSTENVRASVVEDGLTEDELLSLQGRLEAIWNKIISIAKQAEVDPSAYEKLVKCEIAWINYFLQEGSPGKGKDDFRQIKELSSKVIGFYNQGIIEDVIILGVGESDLGARAMHKALN